MKKEFIRKNWLIEFENFKNLIAKEFGDEQVRNLREIMPKLSSYHYNKKKFVLLGEERRLYNFMVEHSYNPFRVYRWLLLEKVPDDIKFQLRNGLMSQKTASKIKFKRKHESRNKVCWDIKTMGLNLVRSM